MGRRIRTHREEDNSDCIATIQSYDGLGRIEQVTNPIREDNCSPSSLTPSGDITTTTYDALGRVVEVKHPDNAKITTSYVGDQTTVTDEAGKVRRLTHDALGRLERVDEDPFGSLNYPTTYEYDVLDNLTQVNQGSQQRTFAYDGLSRLTSANNVEQEEATTFSCDNNGNLTSRIQPRTATSITTTITYDDLNRPSVMSYSDTTPTVRFCYDGRSYSGTACFPPTPSAGEEGYLPAVGSLASITTFETFDDAGRVTDSTQLTGGVIYDFDYSYNRDGTLASQTYPNRSQPPAAAARRKVNYSYDKAGRLKDVNEDGGTAYTSAIQYAPHGAVMEMDLGNKYKEMALFNNRLQPTYMWLRCTEGPGGVVIGCPPVPPPGDLDVWKIELKYGGSANNGNVLFQTLLHTDSNGTVPLGLRQKYSYDAVNRLTSVEEYEWLDPLQTVFWARDYFYDQYGNRAAQGPGLGLNTPDCALSSDPGCSGSDFDASTNRLNSSWATYDKAGNLTKFELVAYEWSAEYDAENKMSAFCPGIDTGCPATWARRER